MKILYIVPYLPFPLNSGGNVAVYNIIKGLYSRGHEISLFCLVDSSDDANHKAEIGKFCENIYFFKREKKEIFLNSLIKPTKPYWVISRYNSKMLKSIEEFIKSNSIDVLHIEHSNMAEYLNRILHENIPSCITFHSLASKSLSRIADNLGISLKKFIYKFDSERMKRYEINIFKKDRFDMYLFYSKHDLDNIVYLFPELSNKCKLIPVGIEPKVSTTDSYSIEIGKEVINEQDKVILLIGSMDNPSNEDAARWFCKKIFPIIKKQIDNSKVIIIGKNSKSKICDLANENIIVVGEVHSLIPYLNRANIYVVPQRSGAGIRVKLLDGLSAQKIIISTSVGVEAIPDIRNNEHFLLADGEVEFSKRCIDAILNPQKYLHIAKKGHEFVKQKFSIDTVARELENIYLKVVEYHKRNIE